MLTSTTIKTVRAWVVMSTATLIAHWNYEVSFGPTVPLRTEVQLSQQVVVDRLEYNDIPFDFGNVITDTIDSTLNCPY